MDLADLDSAGASVDSILGISKTINYVILNARMITPTLTETKHDGAH